MSDVLGFVVIEWNQASHQPRLPIAADLHDTTEAAQVELDSLAEQTAGVGRRETYRLAEVVLLGDED